MQINKTKFRIDDKYHHKDIHPKEQILIGDSLRKDSNHLIRLQTNSIFTNVMNRNHYTISRNGEICEHFDPMFTTDYYGKIEIDKMSISIVLENMGALYYDIANNQFSNWIGEVCPKIDVFEKQYKTIKFWENYTDKQYTSLAWLINYLSDIFNISLENNAVNSIYDDVDVSSYGYACKGNYSKEYNELNPSFDFERLETLINEK